MKCFACGDGELESRSTSIEGEIKGKKYGVEMPALVCNACGHIALEGKDGQEFMRRVADEYRRAHHLLTSGEIKNIRGSLTQQAFADQLGVGVASVKRWELGLVQDKRNDKILREFGDRHKRKKFAPQYTFAVSAYAGGPGYALASSWSSCSHDPPTKRRQVHACLI